MADPVKTPTKVAVVYTSKISQADAVTNFNAAMAAAVTAAQGAEYNQTNRAYVVAGSQPSSVTLDPVTSNTDGATYWSLASAVNYTVYA